MDISDIVIVLIAADRGVQEQTCEILKALREKNKDIIIAFSKIDKSANNENITGICKDLLKEQITVDKMSGNINTVSLSALKNQGIDTLHKLIKKQYLSEKL